MARMGLYQQTVMDALVYKAVTPDVLATATSAGVADLIWACATMRIEVCLRAAAGWHTESVSSGLANCHHPHLQTRAMSTHFGGQTRI